MEKEAVDLSLWAIVKVVISAGVVSALVTSILNLWNERRKEQASAGFLALQIASLMEDFAAACSQRLAENQLYQDSDGIAGNWNFGFPDLAAFPDDAAAWRHLKRDLAERCFAFRPGLKAAMQAVHELVEYDTDQAGDLFVHRCREEALEALRIARDLRSEYGFPQFSRREEIRDGLNWAIQGVRDPRINREEGQAPG